MDAIAPTQDDRYALAAATYAQAIERLARAYEADKDQQRDLVQEIHVELWRSFAVFDGRCSLRTWVYRVAHNAAASHALRRRRLKLDRLVGLDELEAVSAADDPERSAGDRRALARLMDLVRGLHPPDRQLVLLYLEDLEAKDIAEITGLSPGAVATKIHRLKALLAQKFNARERSS